MILSIINLNKYTLDCLEYKTIKSSYISSGFLYQFYSIKYDNDFPKSEITYDSIPILKFCVNLKTYTFQSMTIHLVIRKNKNVCQIIHADVQEGQILKFKEIYKIKTNNLHLAIELK